MNMTPIPEPDPARFVAVNAHPSARHAHQLAGQAVSVAANDGTLIDVGLGSINYSTEDESADTPSFIQYRCAKADHPFVWFTGLWASAMWLYEYDDADYYDAKIVAWIDNTGGISDKYESRVEELVARFGSNPIERAWEGDWEKELSPLWPAVCEVAAMLIDGDSVTHEVVQAAVDRRRR
jgi:hypothetical protein